MPYLRIHAEFYRFFKLLPYTGRMQISKRNEDGNVLFLILIAVVLFAALTYAVVDSNRGGETDVSKEKGELSAGEILNKVTAMQTVITRLMIANGCDDVNISFENAVVAGYDNDDAPDDNSCHVFNVSGGAMSWEDAPEKANDGSDWRFVANRVGKADNSENVGTSAQDLVMLLPNVTSNICNSINESMNEKALWESTGDPNGGASVFEKFDGSYSAAGDGINRGNLSPIPEIGCFCDDGGGTCGTSSPRYFYAVLIKR